nr:immunoglobulin light chain junction region [Macaca mulatta]MOW29383.1 immunoglobulin light chain junction region [Macaca mulatta]MOW29517.1 immunoglobulin light chain junction region [Macaca mulatta]MOW29561.1 immunoglobulin light chain junction region [Macaca mulatta]MOW29588.1 immunoglobulin light chain junction region [Macaca mulatta]
DYYCCSYTTSSNWLF